MQKAEAHVYFSESIGMGDWFYGTTLDTVRFIVEGWAAYEGGRAPDNELPANLILHFPCCYGGNVWEGYALYNYLTELRQRGVKIEARINGLCASIATLVALAADAVLMADTAFWMVHKPSVDTGVCANATDHQSAVVLLDKIQGQIAGQYVARSSGKLDLPTANSLMNQESWLTADECLAYGFVTGKLNAAPLEVPQGAEKVLNYFPTTKPANKMALTKEDKTGLFGELKNWLKEEFGFKPKNEGDAAGGTGATNAATSLDVTGGEPMYFDGAELAQGTAVYSDAEMTTAYADGDYSLADGRDVTISGGTVETLADASADDSAVANAATEALTAENEAVKVENALLKRKLTAAQNKLKVQVPGGGQNPTPPGSTQGAPPKNSAAAPGPRDAERALLLPKK